MTPLFLRNLPLLLLTLTTAAYARGQGGSEQELDDYGTHDNTDNDGGDNSPNQGPPTDVNVPSTEYPTIQAAIDAVANGGTIALDAGVYHESLVVTDKTVTLTGGGRWASQTQIQGSGANGQEPVLDLVGTADVTLDTLTLSHGAYGVRAEGFQHEATAVLQTFDAEIEQVGRGVYGRFASVELTNTTIRNTNWNGVSLLMVGRMVFDHLNVRGADGIGLLVVNEQAPDSGGVRLISACTFEQNHGGGLEVHGSALPVRVLNSDFDGNRVAGVTLIDVDDAFLYGLTVERTSAQPTGVPWGDGVRIFGSGVELRASDIDSSARAGVSMFGCADNPTDVYMSGLSVDRSAFDFAIGAPSGCATPAVTLAADVDSVTCDGDGCRAEYTDGAVPPIVIE